MTRWRYAAATDTGLVRQSNQDAVFVNENIAMVADGMGGHAAGEVASAMTIDLIGEGFERDQTVEGLYNAINLANLAVLNDASDHPEHFGMGTTVIVIGLTLDNFGVASPTLFHVGDSRAYQLRDGALRQLSEDHSVAEEWVRMGRLTPEEAAVHPRRHQLTRGVGVEETIAIDVLSLHAQTGDRILLCSDGLSNELTSDEIAEIASPPNSLDEAVAKLIDAAKSAGGHDNISAILIEFDSVSLAEVPIKRTVSTNRPSVAPSSNALGREVTRPKRFTWRVGAVFLVFAGLIGAFVAIMHWYAYSSYYLADDGGTIAIYQGQPSGVLWYHPVKIRDTAYSAAQLVPTDRLALAATISQPTINAAKHYAYYLHSRWMQSRGTAPVTTTTLAQSTTTTVKG
ncbi:MAG: Stp1/IreP family PP2C-type Ser/Thr phosphatase [Acidimicrobiaceae bacterium]|nr:Stp1/IreP family PP2C-type Ser/Thr phosphatase [Acidimicrobiaceae bacterium]